jgi:hypothetical protein
MRAGSNRRRAIDGTRRTVRARPFVHAESKRRPHLSHLREAKAQGRITRGEQDERVAARGSQAEHVNPEAEPTHPRSTDPSGVVRHHSPLPSRRACAATKSGNDKRRPLHNFGPADRAAKPLRPVNRQTARGSASVDDTRRTRRAGANLRRAATSETPRVPSGKASKATPSHA